MDPHRRTAAALTQKSYPLGIARALAIFHGLMLTSITAVGGPSAASMQHSSKKVLKSQLRVHVLSRRRATAFGDDRERN